MKEEQIITKYQKPNGKCYLKKKDIPGSPIITSFKDLLLAKQMTHFCTPHGLNALIPEDFWPSQK